MRRITLRIADHQYAALSRALLLEKAEKGNRYSLNDLCVRLLMVQVSHTTAPAPPDAATDPNFDWVAEARGHFEAGRTKQVPLPRSFSIVPPPVPKLDPIIWPPAAAPQPERLTQPHPATGSESDTPRATAECVSQLSLEPTSVLALSSGPAADGADPDANESAIDTMVSEGGRDGDVGH
jgi:hypothetical protein